jgi:hypothetical protein
MNKDLHSRKNTERVSSTPAVELDPANLVARALDVLTEEISGWESAEATEIPLTLEADKVGSLRHGEGDN